MKDSCPATAQSQNRNAVNVAFQAQNSIAKVMMKKKLLNELAKVPYYLNLSSPHAISTINAVLRPLEELSRIINQPAIPALPPSGVSVNQQRNNMLSNAVAENPAQQTALAGTESTPRAADSDSNQSQPPVTTPSQDTETRGTSERPEENFSHEAVMNAIPADASLEVRISLPAEARESQESALSLDDESMDSADDDDNDDDMHGVMNLASAAAAAVAQHYDSPESSQSEEEDEDDEEGEDDDADEEEDPHGSEYDDDGDNVMEEDEDGDGDEEMGVEDFMFQAAPGEQLAADGDRLGERDRDRILAFMRHVSGAFSRAETNILGTEGPSEAVLSKLLAKRFFSTYLF